MAGIGLAGVLLFLLLVCVCVLHERANEIDGAWCLSLLLAFGFWVVDKKKKKKARKKEGSESGRSCMFIHFCMSPSLWLRNTARPKNRPNETHAHFFVFVVETSLANGVTGSFESLKNLNKARQTKNKQKRKPTPQSASASTKSEK